MRTGTLVRQALAGIASASGCGGDDGGVGVKTMTGTVSANLADAPLPIDSVARVDVFVVSLEASILNATDAEVANARGKNGWQTIASPNTSYNLLELRGGKTAALGGSRIETGIYRRFRLVIDTDKSSVTLKNGGRILTGTSTPGIRWPSAGQSGLKVEMTGTLGLARDEPAELLIDFNLEESFVVTGTTVSAGGLTFNPVLRVQRTK